jgi:hypothetical protein
VTILLFSLGGELKTNWLYPCWSNWRVLFLAFAEKRIDNHNESGFSVDLPFFPDKK